MKFTPQRVKSLHSSGVNYSLDFCFFRLAIPQYTPSPGFLSILWLCCGCYGIYVGVTGSMRRLLEDRAKFTIVALRPRNRREWRHEDPGTTTNGDTKIPELPRRPRNCHEIATSHSISRILSCVTLIRDGFT